MKNFEEIFKNVTHRLESDLPYWLTYHNTDHTKYVLKQATFLAGWEQVSDEDMLLIKTAALYHDAGFLIQRENHEDLSCDLAFSELENSSFTSDGLAKICGMIKATRIPQSPKTLPEKIVADADLFYLGTDKYEEFSAKLFLEMKHYDPELTDEKWLQIQQNFLSSHKYHTNYCRSILEPLKKKNLKSL